MLSPKVLVVDSQLLLADAIGVALRRCPDIEVLGVHPETAAEALETVARYKPDVVLIDYWLSGMDAWSLVEAILDNSARTKILHLSWFHGPAQIQDSLGAGAVGFLPKGLRVEQVHEAVHRALAGEVPVFKEELEGIIHRLERKSSDLQAQRRQVASLTSRELEVLRLVGAGMSSQEIAGELKISWHTVRKHVNSVLHKLGARSQAEAIVIALDHRLIG